LAAFIHLVPPEEATGELKELYDDLERVRGKGRVSNLFKGYGVFPALAKANFQRLNILLGQGKLSLKLKEAVLTALAEINHCTYCVSFHATAMLNAGATDAEVKAALRFDPDAAGLTEKERPVRICDEGKRRSSCDHCERHRRAESFGCDRLGAGGDCRDGEYRQSTPSLARSISGPTAF